MRIYIEEGEERKLQDPYYKLMELRGDELQLKLNSWTRNELITWLKWNDPNGVYRDEDSLREFDRILSKTEAMEIITRQITKG
ncbi:hypothetical protein O4H26_07135 [Aequorivita viscosa]|nr:hypothetical protein [Aequorivita viscosa]